MRVGVCLPDEAAAELLADFQLRGRECVRLAEHHITDVAALTALTALVVPADPNVLTPAVLAACDGAGVRIVPMVVNERGERLAHALGLPCARHLTVTAVDDAARSTPHAVGGGRPADVIAVWGPHGAPGRTTLAVALASELARGAREVCLIDADSHAPSIAQSLSLSDDVPGLAGACRQIARARFDHEEFLRIRSDLSALAPGLSALTGINRPSRWPELRGDLVGRAVTEIRAWTDHVVLDTAASLERDEQLVSDIADEGPRRNAATLAALGSADHVVAVVAADPIGVARFVRAVDDLGAVSAGAQVTVVANRVRAGVLGVDARGQIRTALSQLAGVDRVSFLPEDRAAHERAVLRAGPANVLSPRSHYAAAVRRLAAELSTVPAA